MRDSLPAFQYTPAQTPESNKEPKRDEEDRDCPLAEGSDEPVVVSVATVTEPDTLREEENSPMDGPGLYILQPRTYTPLPPAPLPSPRVLDRMEEREVALPPSPEPMEDALKAPLPPINERSPLRNISPRVSHGPPKVVRRSSSRLTEEPQPRRQSSIRTEESLEEDEASQPKQRASLRQRVSLRTTPPTSIQVPSPNAPSLQKPVFASPKTFQNYQTFTGPPDSAYGSESAPKSIVGTPGPTSTQDFSPPVFQPGVVPSPHSDQQFFRPVQASPHSPLQQRPATAGAPSRPHHLRNQPSAMGMSMLSTVSTINPDTGKRTLKKKRSAFGWLKKAFTLDDDERAEFDQRKLQEERNLYYEQRSRQFLDGKRLPPRPSYAPSQSSYTPRESRFGVNA
jgi:hypothetical protein